MSDRNVISGFSAIAFLTVLLGACASAPPLTEAGSRVRLLSAEQAKSCKFVRVVQYNDRILGMGKNATVMKAIGETNLRNEVARVGGNAFVIQRDESEWFLGNVAYQGEAYECF